MKNYTSDTPVWSDAVPIVEENDLVNDENDNAAAKQLLQNDLILQATKVDREEGKSLVSDTEREEWNAMYQQATGYTDRKIAGLINGAPSTLDTLGEIAQAMQENGDVVEALNDAIGTKASQKEMESLLGTKLDKTGDTKDNTITFASSDTTTPSAWTEVALLKSGETHKSFAQKVSAMIKNVRYLWKLLGSTDISTIGNGTVTGAISELNTGFDNTRNRISNISNTNIRGYINAYKDDIHHVGITYENLLDDTVPAIVIDDYKFFLVVNNLRNEVRGHIVDFYVDYNTSPWQLKLQVYIDGTIYTRSIPLQDM